jgi:hypothetical protein
MNINKVTNAIKVGTFFLREDYINNHKINIKYEDNLSNDFLKNNSPRVYFIVVNDLIYKIGGSEQKGGIKGTMSFYVNALSGNPGLPRFVIHLLIAKEIIKNNKVELYMISFPSKFEVDIPGLFSTKQYIVQTSFKYLEESCIEDYFLSEKSYPIWNFQESNLTYPEIESNLHNLFRAKKIKAKDIII